MRNNKLNWLDNENLLTEKSRLFKKVFQDNSDNNYIKNEDNPNLKGLSIKADKKNYFETLRDSLLQTKNSFSKSPALIGIISCYRGEGVSTIASNLATAFAQNSDINVLLVDTNYVNPSVHKNFGINLSPGLGEILFDGQDIKAAIHATMLKNFFILTAGEFYKNSGINFESKEFSDLLVSLRNNYSYVIFDSPAIDAASSTARFASLLDGVVLVTEAERVRWEVAQRVKDQFIKANANILGVVLNKQQFHIPKWLYKTL